jgi:MFS family permease
MFVYEVTYLEQVMHIRAATALDINTFSMGVLLLAMPAAGALSDRIGRKPVLLGSGLAAVLAAPPPGLEPDAPGAAGLCLTPRALFGGALRRAGRSAAG